MHMVAFLQGDLFNHHITSVTVPSEGMPETWPYFLNTPAEPPSCGGLWWWGNIYMVQRAWVALEHCHGKQQQ